MVINITIAESSKSCGYHVTIHQLIYWVSCSCWLEIARQSVHRTRRTQDVCYTRRGLHKTRLIHQTYLTQDVSYTRHVLPKTCLTQDVFYTRRVLHRMRLTQDAYSYYTSRTRINVSIHALCKTRLVYAAPYFFRINGPNMLCYR